MWERHEVEVFLTLAEELHFGRTAERLHVTTGFVSKTLKKLELRVGTPLFARSSRVVALTPSGRSLLEDLRPAAEAMTKAISKAVDAGNGISGILRAGYSAPWNGELLLRAAKTFSSLYPGVTVQVREVQLSDPLGPLRAGLLDLQLTEFPIVEPDITTGPVIAEEPRSLIVAQDHPLAQLETVDEEDLAGARLITIAGDVPGYWMDSHYPFTTPSGQPIHRGPSAAYWQEVLALVAVGEGVSITCTRARGYYPHPGIVYVPFRHATTIDYGVLWLSQAETERVRVFGQILHDTARLSHVVAQPGG